MTRPPAAVLAKDAGESMNLETTVVGHSTSDAAKILSVFDEGAGVARLAYDDGGGARCVDAPIEAIAPFGRALFPLTGLASASEVRYAVAGAATAAALPDATTMLQGLTDRFRLLPVGRPLRIALTSCNDLTAKQIPSSRRATLWKTLGAQIAAGNVDLIVHAGDQIYGDDLPEGMSAGEGHLQRYRRHYVNTWGHPDVAAVLASCPSVMMWDDHEIYDGYGSNDNDGSPSAQDRFAAARQAFQEFQMDLNPPGFDPTSFAWSFDHQEVGILAVDGRTHRMYTESRLLGDAQFDALAHTLDALVAKKLRYLFVVVGTPPLFAPILAALKLSTMIGSSMTDDLRDGWVSPNNQADCRRFLLLLLRFAAQSGTRVSIVAGDVHLASLGQIDTTLKLGPTGASPRLYQITSSGISRPPPNGPESVLLNLLQHGGSMDLTSPDFNGRLLPIAGSPHHHLLAHRNFAVLKMCDASGNGWDANGNLWVELFAELDDGVKRLPQSLLGV